MIQHLTSTSATETRCPRCRTALLTALDDGIPARVNATPLPDRQAEITALINGQWTYTLTRNQHLVIRDAERITADTLQGTIHAEHTCTGPTQLTLDDLIGNK
ncbi:hypothetical protein [Salinispora arenicola]|uniref:hypothetical protein n=1 Tax=Salinispora arenicola TaxID=168697 RepID=UPI0016B359FD|nr:hypothetical protein [Salinispora arenicola]NIL59927.1 hypothetical protein [Salinispora arenicola]NIL64325.1 hypothetical protein [Salinispora arenicola]